MFLGTKLQGAILLVKNDLFGDLVDVVPELVGIPMQASVLHFVVVFFSAFFQYGGGSRDCWNLL